MAQHVLTYDCPCCNGSFVATVTDLAEPRELVSERDRATLRDARNVRVELAGRLGVAAPEEGDPVEAMEAKLLDQFAHDELLYATCPGCGKPNPQGLAAQKKERRVATWGTAGIFAALAAVAYFVWSPVAFVVPLFSGVIVILQLVVRRRNGSPLGWTALQLAFVAALGAGVFLLPRWAFLVPAAAAVQLLLQRERGSSRFEQASQRVRFEHLSYRGREPRVQVER